MNPDDDYFKMVFSDNTTGYYWSYGDLYKTTNSGVNWVIQNSNMNPDDDYFKMVFINSNPTSTFNILTPNSNRKLEKVVDVLGRETNPQSNTPFIEIYDDGSTEKKLITEK